ncbi:hypothetical protein ACLKA7_014289 [Drosophila subpalustris]
MHALSVIRNEVLQVSGCCCTRNVETKHTSISNEISSRTEFLLRTPHEARTKRHSLRQDVECAAKGKQKQQQQQMSKPKLRCNLLYAKRRRWHRVGRDVGLAAC